MGAPERRIVVHDYGGYPFSLELGRELARRGFNVLYLYCPAYISGKGRIRRNSGDPERFSCEAVPLQRFDKHAVWRRAAQEWRYGRMLVARLGEMQPAVVLSANTPLIAQALLRWASHRAGARFVFWQQDIISMAAERRFARRLSGGTILSGAVRRLERWILLRSDAVVVIAGEFRSTLVEWGVEEGRITVIENWAPLGELPVVERRNSWAEERGLCEHRVFLYAGTLGLKHNPELLIALARRCRSHSDVRVVVISEGVGAERIRDAGLDEGLENLLVLPFQPYERLAEVLGTADILVAILERDAGRFSVPSKVLSYMCAGRPILAALPAENLAARRVVQSGAGIVTDPGDLERFAYSGLRMLGDSDALKGCGDAARAYAERAFDIEAIGDRFVKVIELVR